MFGMGTGIASPLWPPAFMPVYIARPSGQGPHVPGPGCPRLSGKDPDLGRKHSLQKRNLTGYYESER